MCLYAQAQAHNFLFHESWLLTNGPRTIHGCLRRLRWYSCSCLVLDQTCACMFVFADSHATHVLHADSCATIGLLWPQGLQWTMDRVLNVVSCYYQFKADPTNNVRNACVQVCTVKQKIKRSPGPGGIIFCGGLLEEASRMPRNGEHFALENASLVTAAAAEATIAIGVRVCVCVRACACPCVRVCVCLHVCVCV